MKIVVSLAFDAPKKPKEDEENDDKEEKEDEEVDTHEEFVAEGEDDIEIFDKKLQNQSMILSKDYLEKAVRRKNNGRE